MVGEWMGMDGRAVACEQDCSGARWALPAAGLFGPPCDDGAKGWDLRQLLCDQRSTQVTGVCRALLTNQARIAFRAIVDEALPHLLIDMGAEVVGAHLQADMSTCAVACC